MKNLIGKTFGKLTVEEYVKGKKHLCRCECGNRKIIRTSSLNRGFTKSCGCLNSINREDYDECIKNKLLGNITKNEENCWVWNKSKDKKGYGKTNYKNKIMLCHRLSWLLFNKSLNNNMYVCHKCDNPSCINPDHLFLGTNRDNILDAYHKNRLKLKFGENNKSSKLNYKKIIEIRDLYKKGYTLVSLSNIYHVSSQTIGSIVKRKTWKHVQ